MHGILIEGKGIAGAGRQTKRQPSEILPVFKYLKEPENYMPILINMMLDMIGCYQFPDLRLESEHMKARRKFLTNEAFESSFSEYRQDEKRYYALENNYYIFKEACVISSCDAILNRDKKLHSYCMKVYDAAMFGFQNEDTEQNKRSAYEYGMQFVPYLRYFIGKHLMDNNLSSTVRLGACFWKAAAAAWDLFPEYDRNTERFMYEGKLPEILPVLKKSYELMCCQRLPAVLSVIYDTLEDYFKVLCPEAVSPRPPAFETVIFKQRKG
ncbi:MAG: hypothetical protein IJQ24_11605 [Synergistaceae bacterium]|nr:hypothetical protein [Synergistaceae bacterium]